MATNNNNYRLKLPLNIHLPNLFVLICNNDEKFLFLHCVGDTEKDYRYVTKQSFAGATDSGVRSHLTSCILDIGSKSPSPRKKLRTSKIYERINYSYVNDKKKEKKRKKKKETNKKTNKSKQKPNLCIAWVQEKRILKF